MRSLYRIVAIAAFPAWVGAHISSAAAQDFDDRWSIIPKAHAEPAPADAIDQNKQEEPPIAPSQSSQNRLPPHRPHRVFSGKASFYSYQKRKTASGSAFDRNALIAAHRSLPFGTKVRVTDVATKKSVVVRIVDRGPWARDRDLVIDLSLGAARQLGITDRGVAEVRVEVL
jgi:rare lipoprotein A